MNTTPPPLYTYAFDWHNSGLEYGSFTEPQLIAALTDYAHERAKRARLPLPLALTAALASNDPAAQLAALDTWSMGGEYESGSAEDGDTGYDDAEYAGPHDDDQLQWEVDQAGTDTLAALCQMQAAYGRLHDALSDCIEGGRLTAAVLPDDFEAIDSLLFGDCNTADHSARAALKSAGIEPSAPPA